MVKITLTNKVGNTVLEYESNSIPHKGEHIYLAHHGTFEILDVIYHVTDDRDYNEMEELLFVDVLIEEVL